MSIQTETANECVTSPTTLLVRPDENTKIQAWILHALDSILCLTVFFPSMLFYWRGVWDLYGVYFFPDDEYASNWAVFGLGCAGYLGYFLHPGLGALLNAFCRVDEVIPDENETLSNTFEDDNITSSSAVELYHQSSIEISERQNRVKTFIYFLVTRSYMYLYALLVLAYNRGIWQLANYYLRDVNYLLGCLVGFIVCYSALLGLRCTRSLSFAVFAVYIDTSPELLVPWTKFQTQLSFQTVSSFSKYVADSMFTYFVINTLSMITWRSAFGVYDVILAFDSPFIADVVSTAIGIACCTLLLAMETYIARFAARWHGWRRLVVDDVVTFMQFVSEAFLWRGAWNLNTKFIITDPFLGGWVNHAIGTFLMMSLQIFSYVGTVGCSLDVPDETGYWRGDDKVTFYSTKYLRSFRCLKRDFHNREHIGRAEESRPSRGSL